MYIAGSGTPYWYEWEIGLLECLKMMTDISVDSVVLQSENFQSRRNLSRGFSAKVTNCSMIMYSHIKFFSTNC